jgi:hypothetical protein
MLQTPGMDSHPCTKLTKQGLAGGKHAKVDLAASWFVTCCCHPMISTHMQVACLTPGRLCEAAYITTVLMPSCPGKCMHMLPCGPAAASCMKDETVPCSPNNVTRHAQQQGSNSINCSVCHIIRDKPKVLLLCQLRSYSRCCLQAVTQKKWHIRVLNNTDLANAMQQQIWQHSSNSLWH